MDSPKELSISEIESFLLRNGGKVTNHDLVKHFKPFLTDPATRDEARGTFKRHVNTLALIKTDKGVKYIILKKKKSAADLSTELDDPNPNLKNVPQRPVNLPISEPLSPRQPPPYRPPPVVTPTSSLNSPTLILSPNNNGSNIDISTPSSKNGSMMSLNTPLTETRRLNTPEMQSNIPFSFNETPPKVQRKISSNDLLILEKQISENSSPVKDRIIENTVNPLKFEDDQDDGPIELRSASQLSLVQDNEHNISVKERTQKFNRLASVIGENPKQPLKKKNTRGSEEDDRASVVSLDQKSHDWILKAAMADYQALAKMAHDDPKLVGVKTVLHWASKLNRLDIVKMAAGIRKSIVNVRSNGGYTPLHIAMQFRNETLGNLLIEVYGANQHLRDWSGKKPRQYLTNGDMCISDVISTKVKSRKKYSEKDLSFLRIGSLNMRVKKTTSAFSNFLGVGAAGARNMGSGIKNLNSPNARNSTPLDFPQDAFSKDAMHKSWGSADNIQDEDEKQMPCPNTNKVKRRAAKKTPDYVNAWKSRSTPTTPHQIRSKMDKDQNNSENVSPSPSSSIATQQDSDSDTACGFDAQWQDPHKSRLN